MNTLYIKSIYVFLSLTVFIGCQRKDSSKIYLETPFELHLDQENLIEMVWVKKGVFLMGESFDATKHLKYPNSPKHIVELTDGFWLSKFEITQKVWKCVMGTSIYHQQKKQYKNWKIRGVGDDLPMYFISWEEALEFCDKLNQIAKSRLPNGYRFHLPTEAQWEYTCKVFANSDVLEKNAWYKCNSEGSVHQVGTKTPNLLGIYDLQGNLSEWCYDWYEDYSVEASNNPVGPKVGVKKIVRGGSWFGPAVNCRSTTRFQDPPKNGYSSIGLRLALRKIE